MENEIHNDYAQPSRVNSYLKICAVLFPALILIVGSKAWVGEDPLRGLAVVWVANVLMLLVVWGVMRKSERVWRELGLQLGRPDVKKVLKTLGLSLLVFVLAVIAFLIGPILLPDWVNVSSEADFSRYDFLQNNPVGLIVSLLGVYVVSSFGEEVIYRAFLIHQLSSIIRWKNANESISVLLSSIIFGLVHYEWGAMGIIQSTFMGLVLGACYIKLRKRLWILILAHAYMDTLLLVQLYMNLNG